RNCARKVSGHVVVNSSADRPWSQYFCCMLAGNRDFVRKHPIATKRALRAILKAAAKQAHCGGDRLALLQRPQARAEGLACGLVRYSSRTLGNDRELANVIHTESTALPDRPLIRCRRRAFRYSERACRRGPIGDDANPAVRLDRPLYRAAVRG